MDDPFQFDTDHSLHPGQVFLERYTLVKFLGRGGMGQVWLVRDSILGEEIALKFLPSEIMADRSALEDLKRETLRSRKLSHPHIVKVYDFTAAHKSGAISMEYVSGGTLADVRYDMPGAVLDATDPRFATWMHQLTSALAYAHDSVGIVHRDLKPQNLMLAANGDLKLADFGVARSLTDSMSRLSRQNAGSSGTHIYMSPQQAQGMAPTAADDIYAFGATIYELLTGKPPFFRGNIQHQIDSVEPEPMYQRRAELAEDVVPLPPIPAFWETLVARCLKKYPSERPESMKEIMEMIVSRGQGSASVPQAAPADSIPEAKAPPPLPEEKTPNPVQGRRSEPSGGANSQATPAPAAKKKSPLSWILATCLVLGIAVWGVAQIGSGVPAPTKTPISQISPPPPAADTSQQEALQRERARAEAAEQAAESQRQAADAKNLADQEKKKREAWDEANYNEEAAARSLDGGRVGDSREFSIGGGQAIRFCYVPSGTFWMGSPESEGARNNDETKHQVTLTSHYWMAEAEVTQGQWAAVMGTTPAQQQAKGDDLGEITTLGDEYPMYFVSWDDAEEFIGKLNARRRLPAGWKWSLPTEAQWERACRGGTTGPYAGELDRMGWHESNSGGRAHEVKEKVANAYGLYDMHGNLMEWCLDWYGKYPIESVTDPQGPSSGENRVHRGGDWHTDDCRAAIRGSSGPGFGRKGGLSFRNSVLGFRPTLISTASP
jgi:serine/threonine protein kinase/formylglycine-generating enzyme required for sulfatase activity